MAFLLREPEVGVNAPVTLLTWNAKNAPVEMYAVAMVGMRLASARAAASTILTIANWKKYS